MHKKETIAIFIIMLLLIVGGCDDDSMNEETTAHNNNTAIENISNENATKDGAEESIDYYNLMMSYVEQIQSDFTREEVVAIMGEPDLLEGSGIVREYYFFGEYKVRITYASDGLLLDIINNTTGERMRVY